MLDLLIRGGQVVTPTGVGQWDVAVQGEKIVGVVLPGSLGSEAVEVIDATGKVVIPGGVEAHTHVGFPHRDGIWGNTTTAGPEDLSLAALWGGTTTMMDFAIATQPGSDDVLEAVHTHADLFPGADVHRLFIPLQLSRPFHHDAKYPPDQGAYRRRISQHQGLHHQPRTQAQPAHNDDKHRPVGIGDGAGGGVRRHSGHSRRGRRSGPVELRAGAGAGGVGLALPAQDTLKPLGGTWP